MVGRKTKPLTNSILIRDLSLTNGGEGGIWTHEGLLTLAGFQDQCIQPLCHLSKPVLIMSCVNFIIDAHWFPSALLGLSCPHPSGRCASLTDQYRSRRYCQPLCHKPQESGECRFCRSKNLPLQICAVFSYAESSANINRDYSWWQCFMA